MSSRHAVWAGSTLTDFFTLFMVADTAIKLIRPPVVKETLARAGNPGPPLWPRAQFPFRTRPELSMSPNEPSSNRDLVLTRLIDAPREKLFQAWTDPALLTQWFAPKPYTTPEAELDVRPGGSSRIVMRSPEGQDMPMHGVFLEVEPNTRLIFTDAYVRAWEPSPKPFMTVILTFDDEDGKTRYTVRVRHWTVADREAHEAMGFHQGWGQCADQLAALVSNTAL